MKFFYSLYAPVLLPIFISISNIFLVSNVFGFGDNQGTTGFQSYKYQIQVASGNFQAQNILLDTIVTTATLKLPFPLEGSSMYRWRVREASTPNNPWSTGRFFTQAVTHLTDHENMIPTKINLDQNYPNPFNPSTTIRYSLPERSHVTLRVYNPLGQVVKTMINNEEEAGYHQIVLYKGSLSSGVYFYRLHVVPSNESDIPGVQRSYSKTKNMTIIK
jgi:hypothetical protein